MVRSVRIFISAVGGKLLLLPASITGLVGLVGIAKGLGVDMPGISWWAIAFFALLPLSAWSIAGLIRKVASLEDELEKIKLPSKAILTVTGPNLLKNHTVNHWRMSIHNGGTAAANNIQVRLFDIEPRPRYVPWKADYPYPVNPLVVGSKSEVKINPNDAEVYEIVSGWPNSEGIFFTDGLDTKSQHRHPISIDLDETWELTYNVTAENAEPINFRISMRVEDGSVILKGLA